MVGGTSVHISKHSLIRLKITVGCLTSTYPSIRVCGVCAMCVVVVMCVQCGVCALCVWCVISVVVVVVVVVCRVSGCACELRVCVGWAFYVLMLWCAELCRYVWCWLVCWAVCCVSCVLLKRPCHKGHGRFERTHESVFNGHMGASLSSLIASLSPLVSPSLFFSCLSLSFSSLSATMTMITRPVGCTHSSDLP